MKAFQMFDQVWSRCMGRSEETNVLREDTFINMLISNLLASTIVHYQYIFQYNKTWSNGGLRIWPFAQLRTSSQLTCPHDSCTKSFCRQNYSLCVSVYSSLSAVSLPTEWLHGTMIVHACAVRPLLTG